MGQHNQQIHYSEVLALLYLERLRPQPQPHPVPYLEVKHNRAQDLFLGQPPQPQLQPLDPCLEDKLNRAQVNKCCF